MGGMANIFKKMIPFIMIICLVSYGTLIIWGEDNSLTYLKAERVNGILQMKFDFKSYFNNISFKQLQLALTNVIDVNTWKKLIESFAEIWKDGYNVGDVTKTLIAVVVLILDAIVTIINILIVPLRILAGLVLTALSLVGINIKNTNNPLVAFNTFLLNLYRTEKGQIVPLIPMIPFEAGKISWVKPVVTVPVI